MVWLGGVDPSTFTVDYQVIRPQLPDHENATRRFLERGPSSQNDGELADYCRRQLSANSGSLAKPSLMQGSIGIGQADLSIAIAARVGFRHLSEEPWKRVSTYFNEKALLVSSRSVYAVHSGQNLCCCFRWDVAGLKP